MLLPRVVEKESHPRSIWQGGGKFEQSLCRAVLCTCLVLHIQGPWFKSSLTCGGGWKRSEESKTLRRRGAIEAIAASEAALRRPPRKRGAAPQLHRLAFQRKPPTPGITKIKVSCKKTGTTTTVAQGVKRSSARFPLLLYFSKKFKQVR